MYAQGLTLAQRGSSARSLSSSRARTLATKVPAVRGTPATLYLAIAFILSEARELISLKFVYREVEIAA